jgi:hypothetical protein
MARIRSVHLSTPPSARPGAAVRARGIRTVALAIAALAAIGPRAALAYGGHDSVGCTGCHSLHTGKGQAIFAVPENPKLVDPRSKKPYTGKTAFCLYCHADPEKGGQGYLAVSVHTSHPFGLVSVNPRVARVPPELLGEGGRFECLSCHDAHPSNPNYRYSRVDIGKGGEEMERLCVLCHPAKSEGGGGRKAIVFDSMDETQAAPPRKQDVPSRAAAPVEPLPSPPRPPAKAPAAEPAKPAEDGATLPPLKPILPLNPLEKVEKKPTGK